MGQPIRKLNESFTEAAIKLFKTLLESPIQAIFSLEIDFFQSNSEGDIIDFLHSKRKTVDYCVLNAGALTHYSYALRDAIVSSQIPTVEVHLSNIYKRENFRQNSVIKNVCIGQFYGEGKHSYINGIKYILENKQ